MLYGREWKKMAAMIKTRSLSQIRTHAQKVFQKVEVKTNKGRCSNSKDSIESSGNSNNVDGFNTPSDNSIVEASSSSPMQFNSTILTQLSTELASFTNEFYSFH